MKKKKEIDLIISIIILFISLCIVVTLMYLNKDNKKDLEEDTTTSTTTVLSSVNDDGSYNYYKIDLVGKSYNLKNNRVLKLNVKKNKIEVSIDGKMITTDDKHEQVEFYTVGNYFVYYNIKENTLYLVDKELNVVTYNDDLANNNYLNSYSVSKSGITLTYSRIKNHIIKDKGIEYDVCEESTLNDDMIVEEVYNINYVSDKFEEKELIEQKSLKEINILKICEN